MRLAILSDIHGNLVALEAVLADLGSRGADQVVNLGDCATSPLWPRETMEVLASLGWPTVRGNHDRWVAELDPDPMAPSVRFTHDALTAAQRRTLGGLPPSLRIEQDVLAVHGTPDSDTEYLLEEAIDGRLALVTAATLGARLAGADAGLVLCGHSHCQHAAATGDTLVVNPGSVGCPRYADNRDPWRNEAGSPHARYAIATRRPGHAGWSVEMIALEYDWSAVSERAGANGRADWAEGFLGEGSAGAQPR